jgi:hypothetical protein
MSGIFLGYRRDDASGWAGRPYEHLVRDWGMDHVFMDIDTIAPGEDFRSGRRRARHPGPGGRGGHAGAVGAPRPDAAPGARSAEPVRLASRPRLSVPATRPETVALALAVVGTFLVLVWGLTPRGWHNEFWGIRVLACLLLVAALMGTRAVRTRLAS